MKLIFHMFFLMIYVIIYFVLLNITEAFDSHDIHFFNGGEMPLNISFSLFQAMNIVWLFSIYILISNIKMKSGMIIIVLSLLVTFLWEKELFSGSGFWQYLLTIKGFIITESPIAISFILSYLIIHSISKRWLQKFGSKSFGFEEMIGSIYLFFIYFFSLQIINNNELHLPFFLKKYIHIESMKPALLIYQIIINVIFANIIWFSKLTNKVALSVISTFLSMIIGLTLYNIANSSSLINFSNLYKPFIYSEIHFFIISLCFILLGNKYIKTIRDKKNETVTG